MKLFITFVLIATCYAGGRDLDEYGLAAIRLGARGILEATKPDEILVFIGKSASYFYFAVKDARPHSVLVPISGLQYDKTPLDYLEVDGFKEGVRKYQSVFLDPIRREAETNNRKIVLIDYSTSGKSMDVFKALLGVESAEGIQFMVENQFPFTYSNPINLYIRKYILLDFKSGWGIIDDGYVRLTPQFYRQSFITSSESLLAEFQSDPRVARNIAIIPRVDDKPASEMKEKASGKLLNLSRIVRYFNREDGESKKRQTLNWQDHLTVDQGYYVGLMNKCFESASSRGWPSNFVPLVLEQNPAGRAIDLSSEDAIIENMIFAAKTLFRSAYPLADVLLNRDLPQMISVSSEMRDLFGKSFVEAVRNVPIENEDEREQFYHAVGLYMVRDAHPDWFQSIIDTTVSI